jgi:DNA adenine methylase
MSTQPYTKPFIKWVGGKSQIINDVIDLYPDTMKNYHEIFLGGGSCLFAFLDKVERNEIKVQEKIYAYDINSKLINLYKNIQSNLNDVLEYLDKLITEYDNCKNLNVATKTERKSSHKPNSSKEAYYYWIRDKFNQTTLQETTSVDDTIQQSAMFIFLNKTCFRGVYREGPNGFNVPFGNYKNLSFYDKTHLEQISYLIRNVEFFNLDFRDSLNKVEKDDFVYLDPPYVPENSNSFVAYKESGFTIEDHKELFRLTGNLLSSFLMSNSDTTFIKDEFIDKYDNENKFTIIIIECKRSINSKNPGTKTNELLILKN